MDQALGLDGDHRAFRTDRLGQGQRADADIGADIDGDVARLDDLAEQLDPGLAILAVELDRAADILVEMVVEQDAVSHPGQLGINFAEVDRRPDLLC